MSGTGILLIDGSLGELLVARAELVNGSVTNVRCSSVLTQQSGALPAVAELFPGAGGRSEIAGVVVGCGPGSYTGLRSAAGSALGIARACRVPLIGIGSAEALRTASSSPLSLPIGARESLAVDAQGVRIVPAADAPPRAVLSEIGLGLAEAMFRLATPALCEALEHPERGEVHATPPLLYPAPPRGIKPPQGGA